MGVPGRPLQRRRGRPKLGVMRAAEANRKSRFLRRACCWLVRAMLAEVHRKSKQDAKVVAATAATIRANDDGAASAGGDVAGIAEALLNHSTPPSALPSCASSRTSAASATPATAPGTPVANSLATLAVGLQPKARASHAMSIKISKLQKLGRKMDKALADLTAMVGEGDDSPSESD